MRVTVECDWCKKEYEVKESYIRDKKHHFCSRACQASFSSKSKNPNGYKTLKDYTNIGKNLSELNRKMNPSRMTPEVREKIRKSKFKENHVKSYAKVYGKHEHRIIAEQILGRKLLPGEVVHHIDGNKRNNNPDNILILKSQSEHASLHMRERKFWKEWR